MTSPEFNIEEAQELAELLGVRIDSVGAVALAHRVEVAAIELAARFMHTLDDERELTKVAQRYAIDPARALALEPVDDTDRWFRRLLVSAVEAKEIDPQTWAGAAAVGDFARQIAEEPLPRADQSFRIGESELFQRAILAAKAINPAHSLALPSNADRDVDTELKLFGARFVEIACDLARAIVGPDHAEANARLDGLKARRELLDGLRHARSLQSARREFLH